MERGRLRFSPAPDKIERRWQIVIRYQMNLSTSDTLGCDVFWSPRNEIEAYIILLLVITRMR